MGRFSCAGPWAWGGFSGLVGRGGCACALWLGRSGPPQSGDAAALAPEAPPKVGRSWPVSVVGGAGVSVGGVSLASWAGGCCCGGLGGGRHFRPRVQKFRVFQTPPARPYATNYHYATLLHLAWLVRLRPAIPCLCCCCLLLVAAARCLLLLLAAAVASPSSLLLALWRPAGGGDPEVGSHAPCTRLVSDCLG